ncbi:hypothetical protein [Shewanella woodyi]|uniref:Uncharacterized protein n=1 Tax=Shewanella woodyi (strain ATCC 51908 / MS32) TaxID=392500 RepID=B1KET6_SHEWM|nr:hypothetical protein [Shewanella woodyi]ACA88101.1 hypothetical protein Swoo_3842 [Shewanella woodyi ATCC 51908]
MEIVNIPQSVQKALLGEVPATLRFLYAHISSGTLHYRAVFTDDATDEHLECASVVLTELLADCPSNIQLEESIERNSSIHWRIGSGEHLLFLRHGELSDI